MKRLANFKQNWRRQGHLLLSVGLAILLLAVLGACNLPAVNPVSETTPTPAGEAPTAMLTPSVSATFTLTVVAPVTTTASPTDSVTDSVTATVPATGTVTETASPIPLVTVTMTPVISASASVTGTTSLTTPVAEATPATTVTRTLLPTATLTTSIGARFVTIPPLDTDMSDLTIGQIISQSQGFSSLNNALAEANLLPLLNGPGPLTFFAPTDNAFANYPPAIIDRLMANPTMLTDLLQYHVIVDNSPIAQLAELGSAVTYSGEPVDIRIDAGGDYYVNDVVIVQTDVQAANGVIHVINGLLVPSSASSIITSRTVNPEAESNTGTSAQTLEKLAAADTSGQTVMEIISSNTGFSTLTAAVDAAGLNDALSAGGPITLLAPTNGAFAEFSDSNLEVLLNTEPDQLINLLQYHIILDGVTSLDLSRLGTVLTATGDPVTATVDNNGVITLNGGAATVYMADIEASNGVIHAISAVLIPPSQ